MPDKLTASKRQQDSQPAMRSLPLSTCPCSQSLAVSSSVRLARVCVMRYLWLHCTRRRTVRAWRGRERKDGKEIANCHSNWLFQSPNFQLLSCNLIQSEDAAVAAPASASVELCIWEKCAAKIYEHQNIKKKVLFWNGKWIRGNINAAP